MNLNPYTCVMNMLYSVGEKWAGLQLAQHDLEAMVTWGSQSALSVTESESGL